MQEYLPEQLRTRIGKHFRERGARLHLDWPYLKHSEDSLTGAAFKELRTRSARRLPVGADVWEWSISATVFSSAERYEEPTTGADGIVELWVSNEQEINRKGVIVQSKKQWSGRNKKLFEQSKAMRDVVVDASLVVDYTPRGYTAIEASEVVRAKGDRRQIQSAHFRPFGEVLADEFLCCTIGKCGLYYEETRRTLHLAEPRFGVSALEFPIDNRLRIEIERQRSRGAVVIGKPLPPLPR